MLLCSTQCLVPCLTLADGGTVRLLEQQGNYHVAAFTAPSLLHAGPIDISVLVQDAATLEPVSDVLVNIQARRRDHHGVAICHPATIEAATNKLFRAAKFKLPKPGWWEIELSIEGPSGKTQARFDVEVAESGSRYLALWSWIGWPVLPILLFCMHELFVRRRSR